METTKFESGKTYTGRSVCDYNCIIRVTVAKRTAKTITSTDGKTFRPYVYEGIEVIRPWGNYRMSPIIRAVSGAA